MPIEFLSNMELYNDVNIDCKSENWKNGEISEKISKFLKPKIWVLGNVIRKSHAKFQEASSIGNTQKLRGTEQSREYC